MKLSCRTLILAGLLGGTTLATADLFDFFKRKAPEATNPGRPASSEPKTSPVRRTISYEQEVKPILQEFCYDCHGDGAKKGGVTLDHYPTEAALMSDRKLWERVAHNTDQRLMPPPEKKSQPSQAQRDLISEWVKQEVFKADPNNPDPGRVTIRRLNRVEYNNTIRDLVGVDFDPADDFPADDTGYGFDNIGDVLSLSPIMMEKYLKAAEKILEKAIVVGTPKAPSIRFESSRVSGGAPVGNNFARILSSNGEFFINHKFTTDGEYLVRARVFGQQAGREPVKMSLRFANLDVKAFDVRAVEESPEVVQAKVTVKSGTHRLAVAFLNDYYEAPTKERRRPLDRNLLLNYLEIEGPLNPQNPVYPETHTRIFFKRPAAGNKTEVARELIEQFARRAYRRPVTSDEVDRLMQIYALGEAKQEPFEGAVRLALQAVLVSPHFLFRGELQPEPDNPKKTHPINEFALASRLSYFLWSSMPDKELFDYAERGELRRNLAFQVQRMLKDHKSRALVENFAGQWLMLRNLDLVNPDTRQFPAWDDGLKSLMRKETELFFEHIMREDRSVLDFLLADYSFINERLAQHYGLKGVVGDEFQKVSLTGTPRSGILTHASVLTITSNPTRTSPVKRGLWVLENLLATPPPPPPPDVPPLEESKEALTGSLRVRLEKHRADPTCASCHARMDPIGFGLENFDAIGAWRQKDEGHEIDPSGRLVSGEDFSGPAQLNRILADQKRQEFLHCLAEKMLIYALGRGLEWYDKPALEAISRGMVAGNYRFSSLVIEVAKSVPFQLRRGDGER